VSLSVHWFLPTAGDSRDVVGFGPTVARRPADLDYLAQVARTAEGLGFDAVLTPTGTHCEDAWIATAALIRETRRLRFLVAFRPGSVSPTLAAQQAATFQRLSNGRVLLNVVTGGSSEEQRRFGDHLDHDARYDRTAEFLQIVRGAWSGRPFDFTGDHYDVAGATVLEAPDPRPPIFFGGSSEAGKAVGAAQSDVWLMWGEPPEVAERIAEYHAAGFDHFILSGQPHVEEAWWFGEGVIPRLRAADLLADPVIPGESPSWSRLRPSPN
jgi:alkanesulfonate monooxygenase